jgi:hypothetical protein
MEIAVVIFIGEKTRLAVDAALNDVQRVIRKVNSGATRHGLLAQFRKLNVSDPFGPHCPLKIERDCMVDNRDTYPASPIFR